MNIKVGMLAAALCAVVSGQAVAQVKVVSPVPYSESAFIADNIKQECPIGAQLASSLSKAAQTGAAQVQLVEQAPATGSGTVLKLEIVEAQSAGNAFTGHFKAAAVRGVLFRDGAQVAVVMARRQSRGGAFGGFKGSCDVLERTVNAIGNDLAVWLGNPVDGARLGDL